METDTDEINQAIEALVAEFEDQMKRGIPIRKEKIVERARAAGLLGNEEFYETIFAYAKAWKVAAKGLLDALVKAEKEVISSADMMTELGDVPHTSMELIDLLTKKHSVVAHVNGALHWDNEQISPGRIINEALMVNEKFELNIAKINIDAALDLWIDAKVKSGITDIKARLRHVPNQPAVDALEDLCAKVFVAYEGEARPGHYAACLIRNFMWQVKRKLFGLPVSYHKMLIIRGTWQGTGKSELVKRITDPLSSVRQEKNFEEFLDSRDITTRAAYIIVIDEMSGLQRADAAKLKAAITRETEAIRELYSKRSAPVRVNCTLIGTSNQSMERLMNDPTGTRRFEDVECRSKEDVQAQWDEINATDWLGLWQSVDEKGADPALEVAVLLEARQEEVRLPSRVEEWLRDFDPMEDQKAKRTDVRPNEVWFDKDYLFDKFSAHEEKNNPKSYSTGKRTFLQTLEDIHVRISPKSGCQFTMRITHSGRAARYYFQQDNVVPMPAKAVVPTPSPRAYQTPSERKLEGIRKALEEGRK